MSEIVQRSHCPLCSKTFSNVGNLNKHLHNTHNQKTDQNKICLCGQKFEKVLSLRAHTRWCPSHLAGSPRPSSGFKGKLSSRKNRKLEDFSLNPEETRALLKIAALNRSSPSVETKQKMSLSRIAYLERSPHLKWTLVQGIKVQGLWEQQVAETLSLQGIYFTRPRLIYSEYRTYTPDFYLNDLAIYIEVKGWFRECDRLKYKQVLRDNNIDLRLLDKTSLKPFLSGNLSVLDLPKMKTFLA